MVSDLHMPSAQNGNPPMFAGGTAPSGAPPPAAPPTILVVEDEVIVAEDIRRRLISLGYLVGAVAHSGEAAVARARALKPDLIMMDIGIAGSMDGIQAAEAILHDIDVPVVFATAYSDEPTIERAKRITPYGFVLKPFEERELRAAIEMALTNHRAARRVRTSELRYRTLIEEAADAIFLLDPQGAIIDVNTMALRLLGCSRQEVLERPAPEFLAAGDSPGGSFPLPAEAWASERTEGFVRRPDGRQIPVDVHARLLEDGTIEAIVRDITEHRRVERTLLRRLEKERFVAEFTTRVVGLTAEDIPAALPDLLGSIAGFAGADRVTLCFLDPERTTIPETYESGIDARTTLGPALREHLASISWTLGRLAAGETVCLYQVDDLPADAAGEGEFWLAQGVHSLVTVPIVAGGRLRGFLACTAEGQGRMWNGEDVRLLRVLGDVLGNVLDRLRALAELRQQGEQYKREVEQTAAALRTSEERTRAILENISDVVFALDGKGFLTYVSPSVTAVSGWTPEELVGQHFFRYVHPHDREAIREEWERALGGKVWEFECRMMTRDGNVRYVRLSARLAGEEPGSVIGLLVDMTRRHAMEQRLRESEEHYRHLWEESTDGMVLIDRETGEIVECNSEFARMTGRARDVLRGMKIWELRPKEQQEMGRGKFLEFSRQGKGDARDLDLELPDGTRLRLRFHLHLLRHGDREVLQSRCLEVRE